MNPREYKAVMLGSGGVGKSALTVKFVTGQFAERYDPTVEGTFLADFRPCMKYYFRFLSQRNRSRRCTSNTGNIGHCWNRTGFYQVLKLRAFQTYFQFASMRDLYIRNGQGFILVFSISSKQTFVDIKSMRNQICRVKATEKVPIILVGNKSDLEHERQVSYG